jgi:hypothetical protein
MKGLNRINDYNFGLDRFNLFEDVLGFGFGKDVAVVTGRRDSFCPHFCFGFLHETYKVYRVILVKFEVAACFPIPGSPPNKIKDPEQYRLKHSV